MATYTEHYGLHQWLPEDNFLRTDFNTDLQILDNALGGMETSKAELVAGSYAGNGSSSRTIELGFQPKAVLLFNDGGEAGFISGAYFVCGGLALQGQPVMLGGSSSAVTVEIVSTGFRLTKTTYGQVNESGRSYYYLALK